MWEVEICDCGNCPKGLFYRVAIYTETSSVSMTASCDGYPTSILHVTYTHGQRVVEIFNEALDQLDEPEQIDNKVLN